MRSRVDAYYDEPPRRRLERIGRESGQEEGRPEHGREHISAPRRAASSPRPPTSRSGPWARSTGDDGRFTTEPQRTRTEIQRRTRPRDRRAARSKGVATDRVPRCPNKGGGARSTSIRASTGRRTRTPSRAITSNLRLSLVLTQSNVLMGATATTDKQPFRAGSLAGYRSRQLRPGQNR